MRDALRPRLDRLQELSKKLNSVSDEIGQVVQGVETYLTDVLKIGVWAHVVIDHEESEGASHSSTTSLVYGRLNSKFRFFVTHETVYEGNLEQDDPMPWANCSRELKLAAYNRLPALLDAIIEKAEGTLEEVGANTKTIQALVPPREPKKKGGAS